jgi:hypothetical protein
MVKKQRFALARYRKSGAPSLVALLPQQREEDPLSGLVRLPYGMHMIYLPFADALRFPDLPEALAESTFTDNQRTATKRMIEELTLPSAGAGVLGALRNPAAEAHYRALEAAAFTHTDFSALQPIIDTTLPDAEWLGQPERVEAVDSFFKSFGLSGEPMAAAGASDRQPKRQKLSVPQTEDEWMKVPCTPTAAPRPEAWPSLSATLHPKSLSSFPPKMDGSFLPPGAFDLLIARPNGMVTRRIPLLYAFDRRTGRRSWAI